jgi:shikimate dehydrogenase
VINLGLLGWPVSHSLSPSIHNSALQAVGIEGEYRLFPIDPLNPSQFSLLLEKLRNNELTGLNVTIPHKQSIINYLDEITPSARIIGAVNTIYSIDRRLIGDNTDAPGFIIDLEKKMGIGYLPGKAIVLGAGGSARAVVWALSEKKWQVTVASRNPEQSEKLAFYFNSINKAFNIIWCKMDLESMATMMEEVTLIVNTTPVGMSPTIEMTPWPEGLSFPIDAFGYDLIYNPSETLFLKNAKNSGLRTANGLGMLIEQAALAFEIWTGVTAPRNIMYETVLSKNQ